MAKQTVIDMLKKPVRNADETKHDDGKMQERFMEIVKAAAKQEAVEKMQPPTSARTSPLA